MTIQSIIARCVAVVTLLLLSACGTSDSHREEVPIVRIDVLPTIHGGDSAHVVFWFPTPCYHSPSLDAEVVRDTIQWVLTATREDRICTHNVVPDSFYTPIDPGQAGDYVLVYRSVEGPAAIALTVIYP